MSRILGLVALPAAFVLLCAADAPPALQKAFGNTVVSTYPDGRTGELWLDPSGAYSAMGRRQDRSNGHWSVRGDKLCLKQSRPIPVPFAYCTALPTDGAWTAKAVSGETIHVRLVKGRQAGSAG